MFNVKRRRSESPEGKRPAKVVKLSMPELDLAVTPPVVESAIAPAPVANASVPVDVDVQDTTEVPTVTVPPMVEDDMTERAEEAARPVKVDPKEPEAIDDESEAKDTLLTTTSSRGKLIPTGARQAAVLCTTNEKLLHMTAKYEKTGKLKELHFSRIPHAEFDFTNAEHVALLNAWRAQIYGRGGMQIKKVTTWHADEVAWLDLYIGVIVKRAIDEKIMLTAQKCICDDFNTFFAGKVLKDKNGNDLEPCDERTYSSFASKYNRLCKTTVEANNHRIVGSDAEVFRPLITQDMFDAYMAAKPMKTLMSEVKRTKQAKNKKRKAKDVTMEDTEILIGGVIVDTEDLSPIQAWYDFYHGLMKDISEVEVESDTPVDTKTSKKGKTTPTPNAKDRKAQSKSKSKKKSEPAVVSSEDEDEVEPITTKKANNQDSQPIVSSDDESEAKKCERSMAKTPKTVPDKKNVMNSHDTSEIPEGANAKDFSKVLAKSKRTSGWAAVNHPDSNEEDEDKGVIEDQGDDEDSAVVALDTPSAENGDGSKDADKVLAAPVIQVEEKENTETETHYADSFGSTVTISSCGENTEKAGEAAVKDASRHIVYGW